MVSAATLPNEGNQSPSSPLRNPAEVKKADQMLLDAAVKLRIFTEKVEESSRVTEEQMRRCCCD